jgi:hypothetical protein
MVVGGSLSDFSLGASYANKAIQLLVDNSARRDVCFIWPAEKPSRVLLARKPAHLGYLFVPLAAAALRPRFRTQVAEVRRRKGIREG